MAALTAVLAVSASAAGKGGGSGGGGNRGGSSSGSHSHSSGSSAGKTVHVNGYSRKDGTYVQSHDRAAPGHGTGSSGSSLSIGGWTAPIIPTPRTTARTDARATYRTEPPTGIAAPEPESATPPAQTQTHAEPREPTPMPAASVVMAAPVSTLASVQPRVPSVKPLPPGADAWVAPQEPSSASRAVLATSQTALDSYLASKAKDDRGGMGLWADRGLVKLISVPLPVKVVRRTAFLVTVRPVAGELRGNDWVVRPGDVTAQVPFDR